MGAFAASVLATFEREIGRKIVEHFDLITGTSTGGIIAIGLAMGVPPEEVVKFYMTDGPRIFPKSTGVGMWRSWLNDIFRPRYTSDALRAAVQRVVGDRTLKDAKTRLVIPSYDVNAGSPYLFRTPHHPRYAQNADLTVLHVALATSAAPTYFPAHTIPGLGTFIDGGLWANCPPMIGLVEALDFLGQTPPQVRMLSISTTSYPFRLDHPGQLRGLWGWAPKIIETFMFGQAQSAVDMASRLLRYGYFYRVDYTVPPKSFRMDNSACANDLVAIGRRIAEQFDNMEILEKNFLNGIKVEPFRPLKLRRESRDA